MNSSKFIWYKLEKYGLVKKANRYIAAMRLEDVRVCNDGFPDARSPLTNPYEVRIKIAEYRELYKRAYPHVCYVRNKAKKFENVRAYRRGYNKGYNKAIVDAIEVVQCAPYAEEASRRITLLRKELGIE